MKLAFFFFLGMILGSIAGIFAMCLFQINKKD